MVIARSILAGLLAFGSFSPLGFWWLAPLSLSLLLQSLSDKPLKNRLLQVFLFGLSFFAPLLSWSNIYVGNVPWIFLSLLESFLLFPMAVIPYSRQRPLIYLLFPSTLVVSEALTSRFPFGGFGWGRFAFSQADSPYSYIARWGGAPALSFVVAVLAIAIFFIANRNFKIAISIFGVIAISVPLNFVPLERPANHIGVAAIQGGVPAMGLNFNDRARVVFNMHVKATEKYLSSVRRLPDVIFWPENAADVDPYRDPIVNNDLRNLVNKWQVPIILGAVLESGNGFSNGSILWTPKNGPTSLYRKIHLTPFGEYIPLRPIAEFISPYAKNVVNFIPGRSLVLHRVLGAKIAPIICFELIDDSLGREMSADSNLLLVQTNSATFGKSSESRQQLGISRIRAIEHQRYLVSVSTTGISAIVNPRGKIEQQTHIGEVIALESEIPLLSKRSFSDRHGSLVEILLILAPALLIAIGRGLSRRKRHLAVHV